MAIESYKVVHGQVVAAYAEIDRQAKTEKHWFVDGYDPVNASGPRPTLRYVSIPAAALASGRASATIVRICDTEWTEEDLGGTRQLHVGDWHIIDPGEVLRSVRSVPTIDPYGTTERAFSASTTEPPIVTNGSECRPLPPTYPEPPVQFAQEARQALGLPESAGRTWYCTTTWTVPQ